MEEKKTAVDYAGQIFAQFGFSILVLNVLCLMVGEEAKEISTLFNMGGDGLSVAAIMQFFGVAIVIMGFRILFCTDRFIKEMSITLRIAGMLLCIVGAVAVCTVVFGWFPVDMWEAWLGFLISFGLCFAGSLTVMRLQEKIQNRRMEEALRKLKGK